MAFVFPLMMANLVFLVIFALVSFVLDWKKFMILYKENDQKSSASNKQAAVRDGPANEDENNGAKEEQKDNEKQNLAPTGASYEKKESSFIPADIGSVDFAKADYYQMFVLNLVSFNKLTCFLFKDAPYLPRALKTLNICA